MFFYYLSPDDGRVIPLPDDFLLTDFYTWEGRFPNSYGVLGKYGVIHFYCEHRGYVFLTGCCTYHNYSDSFLHFCPTSLALDNIGKYIAFIADNNQYSSYTGTYSSGILFSSSNFKEFFKMYLDYIIDGGFLNSGVFPSMQNKSWGWCILNSFEPLDSHPSYPYYGVYSATTFYSDFSFSVVPCCELDYSPIVKLLGGTPA